MSDLQHHEMHLAKTHGSGAEEWLCPTCGRRLLMQWPPNYKRIILEAGDESANHSGGKGGLQLRPLQPTTEEDDPILSEELRAALEEVLRNVDFGDE